MDKSQYKNVYVFVEQRDGVVQNVALELLGKARELADALHEQVIALLLGKGVKVVPLLIGTMVVGVVLFALGIIA